MSADWIHEGRRPAGVAGACVLLAARMNNFRRSHSEIVAISHVGQETLQRRLNEFKKTKAAQLSVKSFRDDEEVESANPPSFEKNRKNELRIARTLQRRQQETFNDLESMTEDEKIQYLGDLSKDEQQKQILMNTIMSDITINKELINEQIERILKSKRNKLEQSLYKTPHELAKEKIEEDDLDRIWNMNWPRNLVKNLPTTEDVLKLVSSETELNSDDDDAVVEESQMTPEEVAMKERIWTGLNHDYMVEQERKRLKQEADELTGNTSATSGANRRKRQRSSVPPEIQKEIGDIILDEDGAPKSAGDSAKMYFSKTSVSRKINYESLQGLFGEKF